MKIVLVEWVDSASYSGWHRISPETAGIITCISVGLLCQEDKEQLTLVQSRNDFGNYAEFLSIPKCCIKRVRYLKIKG